MAVESAEQGSEERARRPSGLLKLFKPYSFLTAYYVAVTAAAAVPVLLYPPLLEVLPVGGAADFAAVGQAAFEPVNAAQAMRPVESTVAESIRLALALMASLFLMLPVTWVCMGARRRKDVSQSFIQTILVLPLVITGIVHVVHNSLALAFSLAGIVAGVRFRHTLKDSSETTYLFTSIAVGVACGINAVEVAAIISIAFNYTVLGLWATEFGAQTTGKQIFSREWMGKDEPQPRDEHKSRSGDEDDD
jgi:hypothetical protein